MKVVKSSPGTPVEGNAKSRKKPRVKQSSLQQSPTVGPPDSLKCETADTIQIATSDLNLKEKDKSNQPLQATAASRLAVEKPKMSFSTSARTSLLASVSQTIYASIGSSAQALFGAAKADDAVGQKSENSRIPTNFLTNVRDGTVFIKPLPDFTPAESLSFAGQHHEYIQKIGGIGSLMLGKSDFEPLSAAGVKHVKAIKNIISRIENLPVSQDSFSIEQGSTLCCDLVRSVSNLSFLRRWFFFNHMDAMMRQSGDFSCLGSTPIATAYLALICIYSSNKDIKGSALSFLRANHAMQKMSAESKGETLRPEEISPWWDPTLCDSPEPDKPFMSAQIQAVRRTQRHLTESGINIRNTNFRNTDPLTAAAIITHQLQERIKFLTSHAEMFSMTQSLGQWFKKMPDLKQFEVTNNVSYSLAHLRLPQQTLLSIESLQYNLQAVREAGQALPAAEGQCAALRSDVLLAEMMSQVHNDISAQLVFLLHNDAGLTKANKTLVALQAEVHQVFDPIQRAQNLASLLSDLEPVSSKATNTQGGANKTTPKSRKIAKKVQAEPRLVPQRASRGTESIRIVADSGDSEDSGRSSPSSDEGFVVVKNLKNARNQPWRLQLQQLESEMRPIQPGQLYTFFQQLTQVSEGEPVRQRGLGRFQFYTRLEPELLGGMLPHFVDPGTFSRLTSEGYSKIDCIAASLDYHFGKHVLGRLARWPLGKQTPIEDFIEVGLRLGASRANGLTRTRVDNPAVSVIKKTNAQYFGTYSESNLILTCGPVDDGVASTAT